MVGTLPLTSPQHIWQADLHTSIYYMSTGMPAVLLVTRYKKSTYKHIPSLKDTIIYLLSILFHIANWIVHGNMNRRFPKMLSSHLYLCYSLCLESHHKGCLTHPENLIKISLVTSVKYVLFFPCPLVNFIFLFMNC